VREPEVNGAVQDAATVLTEKIKAEKVRPQADSQGQHDDRLQIIEMLEAFSTSPDKTMSLSNFEKMMIATRLAKK
jgi:hypothetical protein